jgi:hypothetical protein
MAMPMFACLQRRRVVHPSPVTATICFLLQGLTIASSARRPRGRKRSPAVEGQLQLDVAEMPQLLAADHRRRRALAGRSPGRWRRRCAHGRR